MKPKLLFLVTEDWFFYSHFFERACAAKDANYEVIVVTRDSECAKQIRDAGLTVIPVNFKRKGINPLKELRVLFRLIEIYFKVKPDITHHVAAKPILYGTIAALLVTKAKIINAPVGMGYIFSTENKINRLVRPLLMGSYYFLLNPGKNKVIFENKDDMNTFVASGAVKQDNAVLIRGAGVDITKFQFRNTEPEGLPIIALISRMLWDKGVAEFVSAAEIINQENTQARFILVGAPDIDNPSAIPREMLESWNGNNGVEWWGWRGDIAKVLSATHIACLPSYREGLPKSLLEAAAIGLPIVTTDTTGCREVVKNGDNGFLVPVRNTHLLVSSLKMLINDKSLRLKMGKSSRLMMEDNFTSAIVKKQTLDIYDNCLK